MNEPKTKKPVKLPDWPVIPKANKILALMDGGDWSGALALASQTSGLGEHREAITRAQSATFNPDFYRQLGKDPLEAIEAGKATLRAKFEPMRNGRKKSGVGRGDLRVRIARLEDALKRISEARIIEAARKIALEALESHVA